MSTVKVEKGKKYAMIAGMCWIVMGILNVNIEQWGKLIENGLVFNLLVNIVPFACLIGFGVLIFRQKLNLSVLLILGIWLLHQLYFLFIYFVFMNCIHRITFIIFFVLLCYYIIPSLRTQSIKMIQKIWYIPSTLLIIAYTYYHINNFCHQGWYYLSSWNLILYSFSCVGALFFSGLWLKEISVPLVHLRDTLDSGIFVENNEI